MSHYAVATMKKMKADNVSGMLRHDFRVAKNHSNQDIDTSRSDQNIELVAQRRLHKQDVMNYIERRRQSSRKLRRDAVVMDEWIISSDHEFFDTMDSEQIKAYFETAVNYFADKFDRKNIMYANVHMDESTPHMHMGIVPFTKDNKLSSKQVFNRNALRQIQTEFPKYMQEHGFEVVRGSEKSNRKKLSVGEYKHAQQAIKQAEQERLVLNSERDEFDRRVKEVERVADRLDPSRNETENAMGPEYHDHTYYQFSAVFEWLIEFARKLEIRIKQVFQREKELDQREKLLVERETQIHNAKKEIADCLNNLGKPQMAKAVMSDNLGEFGGRKNQISDLVKVAIAEATSKQLSQTRRQINIQFEKKYGKRKER